MVDQNQELPFAVVDVETTGFTNRDRVLEVAVVHADADGTVTDRWSTLVNPDRDIPNSRIHGITGRDVTGAPLFADIAGELAARLTGRVFVAHNAPFDSRLLTAEFARLGLTGSPFADASLCTLALTGRLLPASGRGLSAALSAAGITNAHAHAALGDAEATAELLHHYLRTAPLLVGTLLTGIRPVYLPVETAAPVRLKQRSTATPDRQGGDAGWLNHLATGVPVLGERNADDYLDLLTDAMLDRELSVHETLQLAECATDLGIGRDEVVRLHTGFVRQLAVLAWADGIITDEERAELEGVASALGVDLGEVVRFLDSPEAVNGADGVNELHLAPGDRVTFTGATEIPREVWTARATKAGLDVGGVTKKSVLLVAADLDSFSGKAKKARERGVPVVSESAFSRLLGALEGR